MAMNLLMMPTLHVGQGTHLGGLSVFPVWTDAPVVSGLDTGRAARVQVAEREGSPVVGELVLKNEGAKPALLVAGELFEGGWQHRALNHDILLVAGQQLVASVSCVEHGRWHGATAQVRRSRRASMMVRSAQTIADADDRQSSVWERVSRYDNAFGASPTASYVDHLNRRAEPEVSAGRRSTVSLRLGEEWLQRRRAWRPASRTSGRSRVSGVCSSASVASPRSWSFSRRRPVFVVTCPACSRPPRSTRLCWTRSRRPVVGLVVSPGSWPMRRSATSWAPTQVPGARWLLGRSTTRSVGWAGMISCCTPPCSTVATT